jgi:hypothetical protein
VRSFLAVSLTLLVAGLGVVVADASASRVNKPCGTVTPLPVPNSGGGFAAFDVTVVKGRLSCPAAKVFFEHYYLDGKPKKEAGKLVVKLDGFLCTGGVPPSTVITCKRKKAEITGEDTSA